MAPLFKKLIPRPIIQFLRTQASSGIILAMCAVVALVVANSPLSDGYFALLHMKVFGLSVQHWINDGLMVIFFFVIGMELKKEVLVGELSNFKKASLPIAAAIGGMVVPAGIYLALNPQGIGVSGWGIPMATDIAFALGVLSLFGSRVPLSLKIFLLALAIVDDLGAVLVIAFFYTQEIRLEGLLFAAAALAIVPLLQRSLVRNYFVYIGMGILVWAGIMFSGVHATVAGVLVGFLTPLQFAKKEPDETYSPLDQLVHWLHPWVSFGIMPIFALANAGIVLKGLDLTAIVMNPVHQGVALGLLVGKSVGIFAFSRVFVLMGFGSLPAGLRWSHVLGVAFLGGVGFTMALFISSLALPPELEIYSKTGIILGSLIAAILGAGILKYSFSRDPKVVSE